MKTIAKNEQFIISDSHMGPSAFDGTAARKIDEPVRIISIDRRAGSSAPASSFAGEEISYTFKDDIVFAFRSLGVSELLFELRKGSLAGSPLKGSTPKNVAVSSVLLGIFGVLCVLL